MKQTGDEFLIREQLSGSGLQPDVAVSSHRNAAIAAALHRACDFAACSTLVAAIIFSRNDFAYFRDRARRPNSI
ncbi:hypothetical protein [Nocardia asiatica]|uniref:hypothetical protein n=1 Tax=Nocardia asiatica TaxID=209252 RepID=UPI00245872F9|nr:hypothetical protein [Nocardia asiatica]